LAIWLIPFLAVTAFYGFITLMGLFIGIIDSLHDMKGVYRYYGLTLLIFYSIFSIIQIAEGL
jgi:hypothetical protein